eukprot:3420061-Amphidinium_carterae.4
MASSHNLDRSGNDNRSSSRRTALDKQSYKLTISRQFYHLHKKPHKSLQFRGDSLLHIHTKDKRHKALFAQCHAIRFD